MLRWVIPGVALLGGVALLIWGDKLARPLCATMGLLLGCFVGAVGAQMSQTPHWLPIWVGGGAVVTAGLCWLLFRVWMGVGLAAGLAVVLPIVVLLNQNMTPPVAPRTMIAHQFAPRETPEPASSDWLAPAAEKEGPTKLRQGWMRQLDTLVAWWNRIEPRRRNELMAAALIGAALGLVAGLMFPMTAAGLSTATIGSFLVLMAVREVVVVNIPSLRGPFLPVNPMSALMVLGLITAAGAILQWTRKRKTADQ